MTTLNNQNSLTDQVETLADYLTMAICDVTENYSYPRFSDSEKAQAKVNFISYLQSSNIIITLELIEVVEQQGYKLMASLLREYYTLNNSMFAEAVEALQPERKVTIVKFNDFGFPVTIQTVIDRVEIKPYAQYKESLKIVHKPKRKRSLYSNIILPYEDFIIYDGWINIDIDAITKTVLKSDSAMTVVQGNYNCFNNNYLTDILSNVPVKPLTTFNIKSAATA